MNLNNQCHLWGIVWITSLSFRLYRQSLFMRLFSLQWVREALRNKHLAWPCLTKDTLHHYTPFTSQWLHCLHLEAAPPLALSDHNIPSLYKDRPWRRNLVHRRAQDWEFNKMVAILQTAFSNAFPWKKLPVLNWRKKSTFFLSVHHKPTSVQ